MIWLGNLLTDGRSIATSILVLALTIVLGLAIGGVRIRGIRFGVAGVFQGGRPSEAKNKLPPGVQPADIDALLLTHGHLDHTGRSQQMLCHIAAMFLRKDVPGFPVFLDSPMAIEASKVYVKYPELHDEELVAWKKKGLLPLNPAFFQATTAAAQSKRLNEIEGPCAILAGAGMCTAGRILHHLKFNLPNPCTHVLIVGYQGYGSLGRKLVEREKSVMIFGDRIPVKAKVHTLNGFSGHAGQTDLLKWFSKPAPSKPHVILTHGEDKGRNALAKMIKSKFQLTPTLPNQGDVIEV